MGISHGVFCSKIKSSDGIEKCVPTKLLRKFPSHRSKTPGAMILEIKALPKKCCKIFFSCCFSYMYMYNAYTYVIFRLGKLV